MPAKAASATTSMGATKVMTQRLWLASALVSSTCAPETPAMASRMAATTSGRLPSLKLGTHSMSFMDQPDQ